MIFPASAAILLAATSLQAPASSGALLLAPAEPWEVGTRFAIEMEKRREDVDEDQKTTSRGATTRFDIEVVRRFEEGYIYRWTCGRTQLLDASQPSDPLTARLVALTEGLTYDVVAMLDGTPVAFVDAADAQAKFDALVAEVRAVFAADAAKSAALVPALDQAAKALRGPTLEAALLREPSQFFAPNGYELELGKPLEGQGTLPNPFGGEPLAATSRWALVAHDPARHEAKLEWQQTVDPEAATRATRELFEKMTQAAGKPPDQEMPRFARFEDRATMTFDTQRGLTTASEFTRTVEIAGTKRVETKRFRLLPAEEAPSPR